MTNNCVVLVLLTVILFIQVNTTPIPITISSIHENPNPVSLPPNRIPIPKTLPTFPSFTKSLPYVRNIYYPQPSYYPRSILYQRFNPVTYIPTKMGLKYLDNDTLTGPGEIDENSVCEVKGKYNQLCLLKGSMTDDDEVQYKNYFKCLKHAKCGYKEGKCQWIKNRKYKHCAILYIQPNNDN